MVLANLLDSPLFQKIINFISDSQGALLAIEGLIVIVLIIWQCIRRQAATSLFDGGFGAPTKKYTDNIKKIILIAIFNNDEWQKGDKNDFS